MKLSSGRPNATAGERPERDDAAQAADARAAQQPQQQRLELVVAVVGRQQPFAGRQQLAEHAIARIARSRLEALPRREIDRHARGDEFRAECRGRRGAVRAPRGGLRVQAVVDVRGTHSRRQLEAAERGQQHSGVETAAERDGQARRQLRREAQPASTARRATVTSSGVRSGFVMLRRAV